MSEVIGKVPEAKLSDGAKEAKLWRSAERVHLRDGTSWTIVKVLVVTRYTLIVRVNEDDGVKLIPKHAVDRVDLKKQPQGEIQAV